MNVKCVLANLTDSTFAEHDYEVTEPKDWAEKLEAVPEDNHFYIIKTCKQCGKTIKLILKKYIVPKYDLLKRIELRKGE